MANTLPQTRPLHPLRLAAVTVLAGVTGGLATVVASEMLNWASTRDAVLASGLALAAVFAGCILAMLLMVSLLARDADRLPFAVVGAGVVRMLSSLTLGLVLFMISHPEGKTFWTAFLLSNLLCLVVETTWGMVSQTRLHGLSADRAGAAA